MPGVRVLGYMGEQGEGGDEVVDGPHLRGRARRLWRRAQTTHAELVAADAVLQDAAPIVDALQGISAVVELAAGREPGTPRVDATGAWRQDLAERLRGRAAYLADVVLAWEREHNGCPALVGTVEVAVAPEDRVVVLAPRQAARLRAALAARARHGSVAVRVVAPPRGRRSVVVVELDGRRTSLGGVPVVGVTRALAAGLAAAVAAALVWIVSMDGGGPVAAVGSVGAVALGLALLAARLRGAADPDGGAEPAGVAAARRAARVAVLARFSEVEALVTAREGALAPDVRDEVRRRLEDVRWRVQRWQEGAGRSSCLTTTTSSGEVSPASSPRLTASR